MWFSWVVNKHTVRHADPVDPAALAGVRLRATEWDMAPPCGPKWLEKDGAVVEVHVTRQKNHRHRICNLIINN